MENYKPNSHKSKEEPVAQTSDKRIEKVVVGKAKQKKKSEPRKFFDVFIQDDLTNIGSYIMTDVLIPAIKRTIMDSVKAILGEPGGSSRGTSTASKVSYRSFYDDRDSGRRTQYNVPQARGFDYDDILFDSRADADAVLESMLDLVNGQYGIVSIADMYDLANISNDNYTANNYGWTNLRDSRVVATRDGYMLKLPKALPLK